MEVVAAAPGAEPLNPLKPPPLVVTEADAKQLLPVASRQDSGNDDAERALLTGRVNVIAPHGEKRRVDLRCSNTALRCDIALGGHSVLNADDILSVSDVTAVSPPARGYRVSMLVRTAVSPPQSPGTPGSLPSPGSFKRSEQILSLLSPLWRASRLVQLPRSPSSTPRRHKRTSASSPTTTAVHLTVLERANRGRQSLSTPTETLEIELDTSWEAEAWVQAIGESRQALVRAAAAEDWKTLDRLLAAGRHSEAREANGRSALHYAAAHGEEWAVRLLLQAGASVNAVDIAGVSPIGMAALQSKPNVLPTLLAAGADPTVSARAGQLIGKNAVDMAMVAECRESTTTLLLHSWFRLLPFQAAVGGKAVGGEASPKNESPKKSAANMPPRPTLVLDLDETLVHASVIPTPHDDFSFSFVFAGSTHTMYVKRRPFLDKLLDALAIGPWEVIVFTASVRAYADKLLDVLDPTRRIFAGRLYREHCTPLDGCYTKDLRTLSRPIGTTVLVENTPLSCAYQPDNAILVPTWTSDPTDTALLWLMGLLATIAPVADMRPLLRSSCQVSDLMRGWKAYVQVEEAEAEADMAAESRGGSQAVDTSSFQTSAVTSPPATRRLSSPLYAGAT